METCINHNIVYIVRLCREYCDRGWGKPHMKELAGFCYDLLIRLMCLTLPPEDLGQWDNAILLVDESLREEYIEFYDETEKYVRMTGFIDKGSCEEQKYQNNEPYLWCYFSYTYGFTGGDETSRRKFLWVSLILPYLYRMSNAGGGITGELERLLKDYPVDDCTLEILQESIGDFSELLTNAVGLDGLMPERLRIDQIVDEAKAGLKVAAALT